MRSFDEAKNQHLILRQVFSLADKSLRDANYTAHVAHQSSLAAQAQYAELKVRIEILEDEMDLPEAQRVFKGRHGEGEAITDHCPDEIEDEHSNHPGAA